jgi:ubiquinone/menaquinone biosynthesis C-methylase UbiE
MESNKQEAPPQPSYRARLLLFLFCAVAVLVSLDFGYSILHTLRRLDIVEAERDQWQRPAEVISALNLRPGDHVVDVGCGSGYFALKLESSVGPSGSVIGEDIRRMPLMFLWMRRVIKGKSNVHVLLGNASDPHLPTRTLNSALILNTYHEFDDAPGMLRHLSQALAPGGRLVIVDRTPNPVDARTPNTESHEISSDRVEDELRQAHFQIISRKDQFITSDPDRENWWLIVARNP